MLSIVYALIKDTYFCNRLVVFVCYYFMSRIADRCSWSRMLGCVAGALYMGLLWQAERNFSGAISVERALAQGEGQLVGGGLEDKPFIISAFERI